MREITIAGRRFGVVCETRDAQCFARALSAETGDPFGVECSAATEDQAVARLSHWLEWQAEHASALAELQQAERAYHRTIAGSAFVSAIEGPSAIEMQKESLAAVEAARLRLDAIRARRPD
jgi:hypothetical protein